MLSYKLLPTEKGGNNENEAKMKMAKLLSQEVNPII